MEVKVAERPTTKTISATEASNRFGSMVDEAARGDSVFVVTNMGRPRAVVLGVDRYLELLEELEVVLEQSDPEFQAALAGAREDVELGRTMTLEEFDERFGFTADGLDVESDE
jgi:prevent-host-death family protein